MNNNLQGDVIATVIDALSEEHVIAYPTEAVFGVECGPDSKIATMRLLELRQHPVSKELILTVASCEQLRPYTDDTMLTNAQRETIFSRWPGSVTFVFPASATTSRRLTGRFDSLAVRVTDHPLVVALCQTYDEPLVSTSTDLSGLPPRRIVDETRAQLGAVFPIVLGKTRGRSNPSEVCDALTGKLSRQG